MVSSVETFRNLSFSSSKVLVFRKYLQLTFVAHSCLANVNCWISAQLAIVRISLMQKISRESKVSYLESSTTILIDHVPSPVVVGKSYLFYICQSIRSRKSVIKTCSKNGFPKCIVIIVNKAIYSQSWGDFWVNRYPWQLIGLIFVSQ